MYSTYSHPVSPALLCEGFICLLTVYIYGFFIKYQKFLGVWIYFCDFNLISLINLSELCQYNDVFKYRSIVQWEVQDSDTSHSSFTFFIIYFIYITSQSYPYSILSSQQHICKVSPLLPFPIFFRE